MCCLRMMTHQAKMLLVGTCAAHGPPPPPPPPRRPSLYSTSSRNLRKHRVLLCGLHVDGLSSSPTENCSRFVSSIMSCSIKGRDMTACQPCVVAEVLGTSQVALLAYLQTNALDGELLTSLVATL